MSVAQNEALFATTDMQARAEAPLSGGIPETKTKLPRILIVDDYNANHVITGTYLDNFGYDYDVCTNGIEALKRIESGQYAAVIMDIQMPTMDGVETTTHIRNTETRKNLPRLPVIAMTAHYLIADRESCLRAGMDYYMTKPFNPALLREVLKNLTSEQKVAAQMSEAVLA